MRSLLGRELAIARGQGFYRPSVSDGIDAEAWGEDVRLSGDAPGEPCCDSLEVLRLAAAVNEMFHLHEAAEETDLLHHDRLGDWLDAVEATWEAGVDRVTFMTSGSTAVPKRCTHPLPHFAIEASFLASRFADRRRIVALAPAHHIYGFLFTALLADQLGIEVWAADSAGASAFLGGLRAGDLIVSFPDRWAWVERSLPSIPGGVVGVVSTAPCPGVLVAALLGKGLSELVEVYGSSETAGIALRTDPSEPYRLMPHWALEPATDAEAPPWLVHASGWRTLMPDRIATVEPDSFILQGRYDGAVQVGGLNVHPAAIADRLRACPGVQEAAVRLMRPEEGGRLKAFIVPAAGFDPTKLQDALITWSNERLTTPERPRSFRFGQALPVSAQGKPADW